MITNILLSVILVILVCILTAMFVYLNTMIHLHNRNIEYLYKMKDKLNIIYLSEVVSMDKLYGINIIEYNKTLNQKVKEMENELLGGEDDEEEIIE